MMNILFSGIDDLTKEIPEYNEVFWRGDAEDLSIHHIEGNRIRVAVDYDEILVATKESFKMEQK